MPKIFRAMVADGLFPAIGCEAHKLGVRVPSNDLMQQTVDVSPDVHGIIHSHTGGLSVAQSVSDLPPHTIPKCFKKSIEGAIGSNSRFIWSMGKGNFVEGGVAQKLVLRLKPINASGKVQGLVEPAHSMLISEYQDVLAATQPSWSLDEPEPRQ